MIISVLAISRDLYPRDEDYNYEITLFPRTLSKTILNFNAQRNSIESFKSELEKNLSENKDIIYYKDLRSEGLNIEVKFSDGTNLMKEEREAIEEYFSS